MVSFADLLCIRHEVVFETSACHADDDLRLEQAQSTFESALNDIDACDRRAKARTKRQQQQQPKPAKKKASPAKPNKAAVVVDEDGFEVVGFPKFAANASAQEHEEEHVEEEEEKEEDEEDSDEEALVGWRDRAGCTCRDVPDSDEFQFDDDDAAPPAPPPREEEEEDDWPTPEKTAAKAQPSTLDWCLNLDDADVVEEARPVEEHEEPVFVASFTSIADLCAEEDDRDKKALLLAAEVEKKALLLAAKKKKQSLAKAAKERPPSSTPPAAAASRPEEKKVAPKEATPRAPSPPPKVNTMKILTHLPDKPPTMTKEVMAQSASLRNLMDKFSKNKK